MTERLFFWRSLLVGAAAFCFTGLAVVLGFGDIGVALMAAVAATAVTAAVLMRLSARIRVVRDTATGLAGDHPDARFLDLAEDDIGQLGSELNRLGQRFREVTEDLGEGNSRLVAVL